MVVQYHNTAAQPHRAFILIVHNASTQETIRVEIQPLIRYDI